MPIRGQVGALFISRGVDVGAEVLRSAPGAIEATSLRDPHIQSPEAIGAIGGKVKTETSL
ncbi:MAG: hypothetical protein A3H94_02460 [Acidobacteria bacterium RIFCSPLOWO2_02_FULL_60_20]|nr:MAG: hypothetical protein A3H94_02460 [Acidobacteria bacterium RIFCSPLOWO2_02_FULL_60_20]